MVRLDRREEEKEEKGEKRENKIERRELRDVLDIWYFSTPEERALFRKSQKSMFPKSMSII